MPAPTMSNRYANFDFPEYVFQEYPKWIKHNGGNHIVRDAEEEISLLAIKAPSVREILELKARDLDVAFSADWSNAKLAAFVKRAEADLELADLEEDEKPSEGNDKEFYIKKAAELGVEVDKRWGLDKLKNAVGQ